MNTPRLLVYGWSALFLMGAALRADKHVVVIADAMPAYVRARTDENGEPKIERYVVMQGRFYEGMLRDASIERMSFRTLIDSLAPELARQRYLPAATPLDADLLLVVHWGTTIPQTGFRELMGQPTQALDHDRQLYEQLSKLNPEALRDSLADIPGAGSELSPEYRPQFGHDNQTAEAFNRLEEMAYETAQGLRRGDNASLLGYNNALYADSKRSWSSETARAMREDLNQERYFVIIRAYDLKKRIPGASTRKPVWSMHLNIRAPGNNFRTALVRLGEGVGLHAGQGNGNVLTVRTGKKRQGTVRIDEMIILGEVSPTPR